MSYLRYAKFDADGRVERSYDWHEHTLNSLAFQYGPERAAAILAGRDPATNADIASWNTLGRRGGQA